MTKLTIALLTASLFAVGLTPLATADETKADCEENQGWIGYKSTRGVTNVIDGILADNPALVVCEGEHWDGQDNVRSDAPGRNPPCAAPVDVTPESGFIGNCMNPDPNDPEADLPGLGANALGLRVSYRIHGTTGAETYIGVDIYGVGTSILYVGACNGGPGLEGYAACGGSHEAVTGLYLEDNSEQIGLNNALATVVSTAGITRGYVDEGDCEQGDANTKGTYQYGAEHDDRKQCGRDNTAISVDFVLP